MHVDSAGRQSDRGSRPGRTTSVIVGVANYTPCRQCRGTAWVSGGLNAAGNAMDNLLHGETAAPTSWTAAGGDDVLIGNGGANSLLGGGGNDNLDGDDGADTLLGGLGNDDIDGGVGANSMVGGTGNDFYVVDARAMTWSRRQAVASTRCWRASTGLSSTQRGEPAPAGRCGYRRRRQRSRQPDHRQQRRQCAAPAAKATIR